MPSPLASVTSGVGNATTILSGVSTIANLLIVSPQNTVGYQPQGQNNQSGLSLSGLLGLTPPPSLVFHYEGENSLMLESDITDHYVENNSPIQNHIALRPITVTVQGFIGELNDVPPNKAFEIARVAAQKLTSLAGYAPGLSTTALIAYNEAVFLYQTGAQAVNAGIAAYNSISGAGGTSVINGTQITPAKNQTQQQVYFQQFFGYWAQRTLFTVQTPWAIFQNMALKSLKPVQTAETSMITDFELQFKQIRFAQTGQTQTTRDIANNAQGRLALQAQGLDQNGTQAMTSSPVNFTNTFQ